MYRYIITNEPCPDGCCSFTIYRQGPSRVKGVIGHASSLEEAQAKVARYAEDRRRKGHEVRIHTRLEHRRE